MLTCLTEIVGVTQAENECITGGLTNDQITTLKKSTSGLYLDDLEGGVHLKAVRHADATKGLFDMTQAAIRNAAKLLEDDLVVAMSREYTKSRKAFAGQIGQMSFAQTLATSGDWQGQRIRPLDYSDAVIRISRIMVIVNAAATFNVYLYKVPYKSAMGTLIETYPVTTTANAYQQIIINPEKVLPTVENGQLYEYWILYNRTEAGGALPKDNKLACGTCGRAGGPSINDFVAVNGVALADVNNLQNVSTDEYAHGIIVDVSIKCDSGTLFCDQYKADEAVAVTMAHAVRFKAGELLIEDVLKSPDLNRYTTMAREYLWGKRNHFRKEYGDRINFLAATIDVTASNCYVCRERANQPFVAGIFS